MKTEKKEQQKENKNWMETEGELRLSEVETKQAGWYTKEQIKELSKRTERYLSGDINDEDWQANPGIEIVWLEWFKELKII